jgi:phosphoadenosine phosphosulfate reductase
MSIQKALSLSEEFRNTSIDQVLDQLAARFPGTVVFTTSFGIEDQVITHHICSGNKPIRIATLDTGRLFRETYKVYNQTLEKYNAHIECYFPRHESVQNMMTAKGPNSFYRSVDDRKECCDIRKVEPLGRLLDGMQVWITGIRADQSDNRTSMQLVSWDENRKLFKYNPLLSWSLDDCRQFVSTHQVPYNALHDKGFVSIGCEPCTRAIKPGENFRAGRWWWEDTSKKECGLHS